jgi:hypothetical protein
VYQPYTVIVLSNYDPPSAMRVGNRIKRLLTNMEPDLFNKLRKNKTDKRR